MKALKLKASKMSVLKIAPPEPSWRELAALQSVMVHALLGEATPPAQVRDAVRFAIHRNNVFVALIEALRATYPATERLVGERFFRAAARVFTADNRPSSPVLAEYGEGFPAFLENFDPVRELPYLGGVARLEWLRNLAFHAPDRPALTPEELAAAPAGRAGELAFAFHPSAGLLASPYPIVTIWEINARQSGEDDGEGLTIGPETPGEAALVVRRDLDILALRLDRAEHAAISALMEGRSLLEAFAAAPPGLSFAGVLARLLSAGALSSFRFKGGNDNDFAD
jgi:hypothetical protein